ncbi:MAG: AAA family ATPase [Saprospiraceae bacterium]|nr:AAA family ATPase [Candidatus Brachybacter algidus]
MSKTTYKNIYVAATNQHIGKTTSTLGMVAAFMNRGLNVGYCKPVGQRYLDFQDFKVDKDTVLFADLIRFSIRPEIHSPVILGPGATTQFLDNPNEFNYKDKILFAQEELQKSHELVIYEGTGHPGVGSIVDLSNADVAKLVNAGVIMVVDGGIGKTIDRLNMSISLFREQKLPIIGVIVNKVEEDKIEKIKHYLGKALKKMDLPLLGLMPYDKTLGYPVMKSVMEAINGEVLYNNDMLNNKVEDILAGSLMDVERLRSEKGLLLVVSTGRVNEAISKMQRITKSAGITDSPLTGIVATGEGTINRESINYIESNRIPLISTTLDTYGSVIKISRIEVKINLNTPWKVQRAIELISNNVDLDAILTYSKRG